MIEKLRDKFDLVLINTPPSTHDALRKIASKANMAVIPTKPTPDDLDILGPVIGRTVIRVGYYRAAGAGQSGFETDKTVREEIATVYDNLMALLGDYHA